MLGPLRKQRPSCRGKRCITNERIGDEKIYIFQKLIRNLKPNRISYQYFLAKNENFNSVPIYFRRKWVVVLYTKICLECFRCMRFYDVSRVVATVKRKPLLLWERYNRLYREARHGELDLKGFKKLPSRTVVCIHGPIAFKDGCLRSRPYSPYLG